MAVVPCQKKSDYFTLSPCRLVLSQNSEPYPCLMALTGPQGAKSNLPVHHRTNISQLGCEKVCYPSCY